MRETGSSQTPFPIWALIALSFLAPSCALQNHADADGVLKDCVLNADQGGTLTGRWEKASVPIALQKGAFSASETAAILSAVSTWNGFFAKSMGFPAIDAGDPANPRTSTQALPSNADDFCRGTAIIDADYSFNGSGAVVIYKDSSWPYTSNPGVIALTSTCRDTTPGKKIPFPHFFNGFMEVNFQNFFTTSKVPDLQSIVLHEFGHLMGLGHTCENNSTQTGVPNCFNSLPSTYKTASMYPTFGFLASGAGQQRRSLNDNDMGRMNCVYKEL